MHNPPNFMLGVVRWGQPCPRLLHLLLFSRRLGRQGPSPHLAHPLAAEGCGASAPLGLQTTWWRPKTGAQWLQRQEVVLVSWLVW